MSDRTIPLIALNEMIEFVKGHKDAAERSWPTLLKSQVFFNSLISWGIFVNPKN
jgi:hypothetical protein